jgi:hypothetical protein
MRARGGTERYRYGDATGTLGAVGCVRKRILETIPDPKKKQTPT